MIGHDVSIPEVFLLLLLLLAKDSFLYLSIYSR